MNTVKEFECYITKTETCWLWKGNLDKDGYGSMNFKGKTNRAHRVARHFYRDFDLKSEKSILHKVECPNKHCVNPDHTYEGDNFDNMSDRASKITHCPRGHEYTKNNTYLYLNKKGSWLRDCRVCIKTRALNFKLRKVGVR